MTDKNINYGVKATLVVGTMAICGIFGIDVGSYLGLGIKNIYEARNSEQNFIISKQETTIKVYKQELKENTNKLDKILLNNSRLTNFKKALTATVADLDLCIEKYNKNRDETLDKYFNHLANYETDSARKVMSDWLKK
jgi:adenylate kinase family enzyme